MVGGHFMCLRVLQLEWDVLVLFGGGASLRLGASLQISGRIGVFYVATLMDAGA
jgi:hypothetical protein